MKWEIVYAKGVFEKLHRLKNDLPAKAHWVMFDSLERGIIQKILDDLKDEPLPHRIRIYDPNFYFTVVSDVNYKRREIAIVDVKHGDKRRD